MSVQHKDELLNFLRRHAAKTAKLLPIGDSKSWLQRSWSHQHVNGAGPCWQCEASSQAARDMLDRLETHAAEVARLTAERDEARSNYMQRRNIETPCVKCAGDGWRAYGSTATWRGGVGGQTITSDVCDRCWGSGDEHKRWPSWRTALAPAQKDGDRG